MQRKIIDPDNVNYIKIHGLQRSGTNYLTHVLNQNFKNTEVLVNLGGWKHGTYIIPFVLGDIEVNVAVITKNPYSWLVSVYNYWKTNNLGPNLSNVTFEQFVTTRSLFEYQDSIPFLYRASNAVQYWNNMNSHWVTIRLKQKKMVIVSYETILNSFQETMKKIGQSLCLNPINEEFKNINNTLLPGGEGLKVSEHQWHRKEFYQNKQYLSYYTPELLKFVNQNLDEELMKILGYQKEDEIRIALAKANHFWNLKDYISAEKCLEELERQNSDDWKTLFNLGSTKCLLDKNEEGLKYFDKAYKLGCPEEVIEHNKALAYRRMSNYQESIKHIRKSIELSPNRPEYHTNLAACLLIQGDWKEGWKEWEWRTSKAAKNYKELFKDKPDWDGKKCNRKRILVYNEQGRGDLIQFLRYLPMLKKKGAIVILDVREEMKELLSGHSGIDFIFSNSEPVPEFDMKISISSLPYLFKTTIDNVPNQTPYIFGKHNDKLNSFYEKFNKTKNKFSVGICWAGSPTHAEDETRSFSNEYFMRLKSLNIQMFGLQKINPGQENLVASKSFYKDLIRYSSNFNDLTNLIMPMDLIISADTAIAHLAGALNKPVWLLLPKLNDFRWLLDREDTPWYPSMRLFRQNKSNVWDDVFDNVKLELKKIC